MSYEDELIRRLAQEGGQVRSELARRAHYLKMAGSGALLLLCFGLFSCGVLGGRRSVEQAHAAVAARGSKTKQKTDAREAGKHLAAASGPELAALLVGSASGLYFLVLLMRLRRLD